jgi:hypothetical protein
MVGWALVSIRISNGKKIFKCCLHFLILILVLSAVLQPALLCVQFADSAGNIAAGALLQKNTLYNGIF